MDHDNGPYQSFLFAAVADVVLYSYRRVDCMTIQYCFGDIMLADTLCGRVTCCDNEVLDITYHGIRVSTRMRTRNSFGANGRAHRSRIVCAISFGANERAQTSRIVCARSTCLAGVIASRVEAQ